MELSYNGIQFEHIHCTRYDQEAVFEKSNTDYLYTKVTIGIQAVMAIETNENGTLVGLLPSNLTITNETDVQATMVRVRSLLETPRQVLLVQDNSHVLLYTYGAGTPTPTGFIGEAPPIVDVKLGPFGKVINITRFDGSQAFHVLFEVETYIIECAQDVPVPIVLTHRWTEQMSFDKIFRMTYKRSGTIVISANKNSDTGQRTADALARQYTFLPLRNGFRRNSGRYVLSEDFLALNYELEDVQLFRTFPQPALDGSGTYSESTGKGASIRQAACHVRLQGTPDGSQSELLRTAICVCMNQFGPLLPPAAVQGQNDAPAEPGGNGAPAGQNIGRQLVNLGLQAISGGGLLGGAWNGVGVIQNQLANRPPVNANFETAIILRASISYDLFENAVAVDVEARLPFPQKNHLGLPFPVLTFVEAVPGTLKFTDSPPPTMPIPVMFGQTQGKYVNQNATNLILLSSALGIPCTPAALSSAGSTAAAGVSGGGSTTITSALAASSSSAGIAQGASGQQLAEAAAAITENRYNPNAGFYSEYEMQMFYRHKENILALPNATPAGGPKTASIVQWANPIEDAFLEFTASRIGDWPTLPSPKMSDTNLVFIDSQIIPEPPIPGGDGFTLEYTVQGKYYYAIIDPSKTQFRTGLYPWMTSDAAPATTMPINIFDPTVMQPGSSGGTPTPSIPSVSG